MSRSNRLLTCPNEFRENIIKKMQNITNDENISINLEKGIFNVKSNDAL